MTDHAARFDDDRVWLDDPDDEEELPEAVVDDLDASRLFDASPEDVVDQLRVVPVDDDDPSRR
jgi:hypothetical protein